MDGDLLMSFFCVEIEKYGDVLEDCLKLNIEMRKYL